MRINEALKRKEFQMMDMKASVLILKYEGINNLLKESKKTMMDKELIHY